VAGQKRYREFVRKLEAAALDAGYDDAIHYIIERIANGESLVKIAKDVGQMSRWTLYIWLKDDPERWRLYQQAREVGADALVDEAQEILDTADHKDSASVASARNRAQFRQWQAEMRNPRTFGRPTAKTEVNLNVGLLHLDTLRKLGGPESLPQGNNGSHGTIRVPPDALHGNGGHRVLPTPTFDAPPDPDT